MAAQTGELAWLRREIEAWREEGLITEPQARAILDRYGATPATPGALDRSLTGAVQSSGKIIATISILGAILLGLGVILFFAANWEEIPKAARVVLLFGTTFTTWYAGWEVRFNRESFPKTGAALLFLGSLFFGASIFLTAQTFNVNEDALPDLLLLWLLGTVPVAYALHNPMTSALNVILATVWLNFKLADLGVEVEPGAFVMLNLVLGGAWYALGKAQGFIERLQLHALPFRFLGVFVIAGALYFFTFDVGEDDWLIAPQGAAAILYLALLGLTVGATVYAHRQGSQTGDMDPLETGTLLTVAGLAAFFLMVPQIMQPLPANLYLAGFILVLILIGYRGRDVNLVNLALLFAVVDIVTRYFDFFYDLLDRSLFFILGGILLLVGAVYGEKERKKLIARIREEEPA